jgi:peptidoglycan hydrolase-like protein with peptidoglycan-binding domain
MRERQDMITMYDASENGQFPHGAAAYAAYVDGGVGDQPNYQHVVSAYPQARHLSITLSGGDADAADVEPGAMVPSDIPAWHARQVARGITRPVVYASASTMNDEVLAVLRLARIPRSSTRLWTAHYGAGEHVCAPSSCGDLCIPADGTQWTDSALGRNLDQSLLLDDFFGTSPVSTGVNWTEQIMQQLPELSQGATGTFVRTVQFQLGERGHPVPVDGDFGIETLAAVKTVQSAFRVAVDGAVGPVTWGILIAGSAS